MTLFRERADVSVRPAVGEDDHSVARIQMDAWRAHHGSLLGPDVLDQLDVEAVRDQWERAITEPPTAGRHVLVACQGAQVVGLAALAPADDGAEVVALEVDPDHQRSGHGSRLLAACVDLAREAGHTHLQTWVLDRDEARTGFLASAGLGPDGARRELGISADETGLTRTVNEHRWVAEI
ncbi:GNAT family N-acetyltransferase [Cellulomonas bogoriensis]|uniref:GNAT family acetyltransferase n=1 Tax=Cellulomonas bogoriensis 69B4 = DSM 16987 TaxID=1386082 RepID=A0A0A0C1G8_9CELL|nr:GNAT family N-acetyltransferase [Cellulomonas bogoriensis]KGM13209.1 GNAT family acetyltransferase [Cellulomonas bogoriensis 69B4 = DSM 16987]